MRKFPKMCNWKQTASQNRTLHIDKIRNWTGFLHENFTTAVYLIIPCPFSILRSLVDSVWISFSKTSYEEYGCQHSINGEQQPIPSLETYKSHLKSTLTHCKKKRKKKKIRDTTSSQFRNITILTIRILLGKWCQISCHKNSH